jgi:hypothetical protein
VCGVQYRSHHFGRNGTDCRGKLVPSKTFRRTRELDRQEHRGLLETTVFIVHRVVSNKLKRYYHI